MSPAKLLWCSVQKRVKWVVVILCVGLVGVILTPHSRGPADGEKENIALDIKSLLSPPKSWSTPYNLTNKNRKWFSQFKQDQLVTKIFRRKTGGFFIEAGALDGEIFSNTLYLERELNWTGLLIEPIPQSYQRLLSKNRKAYSFNACISPSGKADVLPINLYAIDDAEETALSQLEGGPDQPELKIFKKMEQNKRRNAGKDTKVELVKKVYNIPCFPLEAMLQAVGNPIVDYFSLDVEGFEMKILQSIDWDRVNIRLIGIEINHVPEGKEAVKTFMESKGFKFYKELEIDYFFYKPELTDGINLKYKNKRNL